MRAEGAWRQLFARHFRAAVEVGSLGGGLLGAALGILLARQPNIGLLLAERSDRRLAIAVLAAAGGILATVALIPLALAAATLSRFSPSLAPRLRPRRLAATGLVVAALALDALFRLAFGAVHDVLSVHGALVLLGLFAAAVAALLAAGVDWHRSPPPIAPPATGRHPASALLLLLFAALLAWGWPQLRQASHRGTPVVADAPAAAIARRQTAALVPRVILISIDTLRADHLSLYGYRRPTSPALEALAADGTVFEHVHSQAPWTLPSHASMFTGKYPWAVGVQFIDLSRILNSKSLDRLSPGHSTMAELLAASGYRTAGIASMHWFTPPFGLAQGFERMLVTEGDDRARQVVDRALEWTLQARDQPSFFFFHFFDVHEYQAPASFVERYLDASYRGQFLGRPKHAMGNLGHRVGAEDLRYLEALYDAAATYVDSELGRFFGELRRRGLYDDSLIIVTADHGEAFLEHGRTGHLATLYEEELRVPLVVKPPRSFPVAVRRSEAWVGLVDLLPTVLDYVGAKAPDGIAGSSLRAAVEGLALPERRLFAGATLFQNTYAAFESSHAYILHRVPPFDLFRLRRWQISLRAFYGFGPPELFDLAIDPGQRNNLFSRNSRLAGRLKRRLLEELAAHRRSGGGVAIDEEETRKLRALGYLR